ncbi:penicillin amidase [Ekhidna lutea]|uniref:Penicillin amidase n=1 Tax=Ekhidna lutea TaxID=447679 RepID=A0A239H3F0_EKHLU|nr:penicillin acylase family protein [Ekhidna lutea]SNS75996.1 penicillin amidase [Ekhidna lutea]
MKVVKIALVVVLLLILGAAGYYVYLKNSLTPSYSGDTPLNGLSENVDIYFTEYGIPHIYADSEEDSYRALGYIHAMERLWQMDLLRHVGSGRLSELFGSDMVEVDKFLRTMGLSTYAESSSIEYQSRNHESLPLVEAYIEGINFYIENNPKPLEYTLLGLDVEPFEIQNVFETLTYMSFSFSNAHITDPVLTELSQQLDSSYLEDLNIYHYQGESTLRSYDDRYSNYSKAISAMLHQQKAPEFIGSNSWVLSGKKTETGSVILANDPHIAFSQPSVWYESHLTSPDNEYYGYHIPGSPFPLLMHSDRQAIGITMFENDDMDFYIEEIHPEDSMMYMHKGEWKEVKQRPEKIKVKGDVPVTFTVRSTVHGPIVSDILKEEPLQEIVTMHWVTTNHSNYMIEAIYGFINSSSIEEIENAASTIHGPGLNIMYGDAEGNVAWWAVGKLNKRRNEQASKTFYDGSLGLDDPDSTYSFQKNPHAINPDWGYVHSANNQPDTLDGVVYSGYYLPDDRGERITEIIDADSTFTIDQMKSMLLDDKSMMHEAIKGIMLHAIKDTDKVELLRALIKWDATFNKDDFKPLIFQKWLHEILLASQKDEIGEDLWNTYKKTHTYKVAAEHLIKNERSKWWDNVETEATERRSDIVRLAFEKTIQELSDRWGEDYTKWKWGDVHLLTHKHATGDVLSFLNVGSFAVSGGNEVINNMGYTYSEDSEKQSILFGPSTRRIVDFADVRNNSWSILPTGQSGNYFSPHYADQAEMYVNGEFRKMMMDHDSIKLSKNKLILYPAD